MTRARWSSISGRSLGKAEFSIKDSDYGNFVVEQLAPILLTRGKQSSFARPDSRGGRPHPHDFLFLSSKNLFYGLAEQLELGDFECQGQAGIVFLCFEGIDGLAGDAELVGEVGLGPVELRSLAWESL